MKRGTARHPKTERLMGLLAIDRAKAAGTLELLWEFAKEFAIEGDVGRWSDADIARAVDWGGDPALLVAALVEAGWVDECQESRLVIHDVEDHADQPWKRLLQRRGVTFRRAVPLAMASRRLAMASLARGTGTGSGSSSVSRTEPPDPERTFEVDPAPPPVAAVRPEPQGSLAAMPERRAAARVRRDRSGVDVLSACPLDVAAWAKATPPDGLGWTDEHVAFWHDEFRDAVKRGAVKLGADPVASLRASFRRQLGKPIPRPPGAPPPSAPRPVQPNGDPYPDVFINRPRRATP